ncbi:hypothetical protein CRE_19349 [Caenorhabditis remanei]|uniref:Uncharacterized protein n=1 Tax=Caenorhabditis remanei TaxID=31234 RepID=E3N538_CAERE|nr:hypothetical protein CRE_19349 [Caenorhabditis remanei]
MVFQTPIFFLITFLVLPVLAISETVKWDIIYKLSWCFGCCIGACIGLCIRKAIQDCKNEEAQRMQTTQTIQYKDFHYLTKSTAIPKNSTILIYLLISWIQFVNAAVFVPVMGGSQSKIMFFFCLVLGIIYWIGYCTKKEIRDEWKCNRATPEERDSQPKV